MSTFSPKRPDSRAKDRYSPSGPNVTFTRNPGPKELPGTAVYGLQEIPVKRPQKDKFEKSKAELNVKQSKIRPSINTKMRKVMESNRTNPIAMNPIIPSGSKKDTPTFRSSPGNPLNRQQGEKNANGNSLRSSSRYAARLKFEAAHSNSPASDENKYASQWEACRNVKEAKTKETSILRTHPHGATQGLIYHTRPQGLSLPGLGYGTPSCQS